MVEQRGAPPAFVIVADSAPRLFQEAEVPDPYSRLLEIPRPLPIIAQSAVPLVTDVGPSHGSIEVEWWPSKARGGGRGKFH